MQNRNTNVGKSRQITKDLKVATRATLPNHALPGHTLSESIKGGHSEQLFDSFAQMALVL